MRLLVIDKTATAGAAKVKAFGLMHRLSVHDVMRLLKGQGSIPGDDTQRVLNIVDGWRVVYTVEQHPGGWFHHISISIAPQNANKPFPNDHGVQEILNLFGLGLLKNHTHGWVEDSTIGQAINLLFPFTEPAS